MNTNLIRTIVAASLFAFSASAAAQQTEPPVAVKTDGLPEHLRARIEAKAQEGPTALIRYVNSTRHLHNLRVEEIVVSDADAAKMVKKPSEPTKVAEKDGAKK